MKRAILAAGLAALLAAGPLPTPAGAGALDAARAAAHREACNHYDNRARFRPRTGADFITVLAENCAAARAALGAAGSAREARAFLDGLVRFYRTINEMRLERMFGDTGDAWGRGRTHAVGRISETGEFLIAHRMGLIDAFEDWRAAAPGKVLALTD